MNKELSVLIPTYNRKEKLKKTLLALEKQFDDNFYVVILDNASEYSIEQEVLPELSFQFSKVIRIIKRKYNVGLGNNISGLFSVCETKWGWLLGDDDVINSYAINTVLKNISNHPDYAGFWFALDGSFNDRVVLSTPDELIRLKIERDLFYESCYLSNKVYNFDYINCCSDTIYTYSYTMISFSLAIFELLRNNCKYEVVFNESIVSHPGFADSKPTWNFVRVASGMRTVADYPLTRDKHLQKMFLKGSFFNWKVLLSAYLSMEETPVNYQRYLKNIYYNIYTITLTGIEKIICKILFDFASTRIGFIFGKHMLKIRRKNRDKA